MAGCCGNKVEPESEKTGLQMKPKKTTDILCLLIFFAFWVIMLVIGFWGFQNGVPERLLYGQNMEGDQCGKGTYVNQKLTYYPKLNEDILQTAQELNTDVTALATNLDAIRFNGVCVEKCPKKNDWICNIEGEAYVATQTTSSVTREGFLNTCYAKAPGGLFIYEWPLIKGTNCETAMKNCWMVVAEQREILFRCIDNYESNTTTTYYCSDPSNVGPNDPSCKTKLKIVNTQSEEPSQPNYLVDMLTSANAVFTALFGDLMKSWLVVVIVGIVGGIVCGFAWVFFLRLFAGVIVLLTIVALLGGSILFTLFALVKAGIVSDPSLLLAFTTATSALGNSTGTTIDTSTATNAEKEYWTIGAIALCAFDIIFLMIIVAVKHQISVAIRIIEVSTEALASMVQLIIFPFYTVIWTTVLFAYCGVVFAYLASAGQMTSVTLPGFNLTLNTTGVNLTGVTVNNTAANSVVKSMSAMPMKDYAMAVHFFGLLWTQNFIQGVGVLTICGCYVEWYCRDTSDAEQSKMKPNPVMRNYWNTLRYHLGSVAFGSFIIAVVQFIRYLFEYLQKQAQGAEKRSKLVKALICLIRCCLWCFEKFVKYITKSAYIMIALRSKSFFYAAVDAFSLIFTNGAQVAVMAMVGSLVCMIGRLVITAGCGVIAYVWLRFDPTYSTGTSAITSPIMPVIFTLLLGYFVACSFMEVYGMGIDSLLMCYIADKAAGGQHKLYGWGKISGMKMPKPAEGSGESAGKPVTDEKPSKAEAEDDDDGIM